MVSLHATRLSARLQTVAAGVLALLLLCLPVRTGAQEDAVVVYVDTQDYETTRDDSCMPPRVDTPCTSLEAIASGITSMENLTSLEIVIRSPRLELKEPVKFEGLSVVKIVGAPTQIQCVSNSSAENSGNSTAGVAFVTIENLLIEDVQFELCGSFHNYPTDWESDYWKPFRAAIHIFNSTNILVRNIAVSASNGAGMAVSNVHGGTLNISDSLFDHNAVPEVDRVSHAGGGGIFVQVRHHLSEFVFTNCTFVNNTASTTLGYLFSNIFGTVLRGRGHGGGLLVRILDDASNNSVKVTNCNFIRNSAFFGGGLGIKMYHRSRNNVAVVSSSYFEENGCHGSESSRSWSAGGLHLGYNYRDENGEHVHDNVMVIEDSVFTRNCAEKGGGVTFYSSRSESLNANNRICFLNCSWIENSGRIGSAVDISPHTEERLSAGFVPIPEFTDCQFINNSVVLGERGLQQASGTGALFSSQLDIKFNSSVLFEHNTDSALVLVNAVADFSSCNATFVNNTGVQGGAISLVGVSLMVIGPGHAYVFCHNKATDRGGAISSYLIDEHDFSASRSCFMQYSERVQPSEWKSTLTFVGNEAPIGKSIFTTSITPCLLNTVWLSPEAELNQSVALDPTEVFHWPGVFTFDDPTNNQIGTDGANFNTLRKVPFEIIPGEEHSLQVNITDDLDQLVDAIFRATVDGQEKTDIEIDSASSYVEDNNVQLRGEVGEKGALLLQFVSPRKTSILLDFVLVPCPVGYALNTEKECECDVNSYEGLTECNTSSLKAYIREGFWAGYRRGSLVTAICPIEFCHYNDSDESTDILLPRTSSNVELDDFICGPSRTGVLCGDCTEGHSAYYHSQYFSCQENNLCIIGWLLYILSELVPATFLFVCILFFNVKFTSGKLNGFIFFSQLLSTLFVDATDVIKVSDAVHILSWGYRIIYGFFSLDFFTIEPLSFCLWEGATVLDVLAFKYVTIAYSLILVILVIVFMKYFVRKLLGNRIKISPIENSVIHGISAFLVVCYMQCIKVSLKILLSKSLQGEGGTLLSPARVWFSGEIEVFSAEHIPYAFPALLCLLTLGVIPPIILLVYPLNYRIAAFFKINDESYPKLTRLTKKIALDKLKPVLDSFQGCFKDNFRFFAGLYFVYRWVGLLAYAVSPTLSGFYTTLQAMLTLMLLIHAVAQPYEDRWYNVVDALLLTDLALINMLTGFNYYYTRVTAEEVRDQQVIDVTSSFQLILIYLPILAMCVYLMVKGYKLCSRKRATKKRDTVEESLHLSFSRRSTKSIKSHVTTSDIGSLQDFPARLLVEYHEMEPDEEETIRMSPGLPPSIPPAYDPL